MSVPTRVTWAFIWNIVLNIITLVLAAIVTSKANTDFEALVFLMALIAYHRLLWFIDSGYEDNRQRTLLIISWFYRLENLIKNESPRNDAVRGWLAEIKSDEQLMSLKDNIEINTKKRSNAYWIHAITEVILMLVVVGILVK